MTETTTPLSDQRLSIAARFHETVLSPMKRAFIGKDEIIDLFGIGLVGRENVFLLGPPGTAKSALVQDLARRLDGQVFDYLLTRFTEPNELFGPFDIRKLREGELVTNTEGMLPEASLVFLDELLNANSAILNSLLLALNERVFRRGRETRALPTLMVVGASNRLPEEEALNALFDRFLLRVPCDNVPPEQLADVLDAGWQLDVEAAKRDTPDSQRVSVDDVQRMQSLLHDVDVMAVRNAYTDLVHRLRHAGIDVSDRRAVKFQRLMAASAILCGRQTVQPSDLWVLRYTWETEEQQQVLTTLVQEAIERNLTGDEPSRHPRSHGNDAPDPEALARDLDRVAARLSEENLSDADRSYLRDQLSVLAGRCAWVTAEQQRLFLQQRVEEIWKTAGESS
ncbi:MAG: AAA family ATPase [Planctomycetaceae bacterium]|nr:AAA family ATPase [Planctomycetaceae bacterium]